jgi:hypothetical protein
MTEDSARVLSFLNPDQVARLGVLPPEAIVGFLAEDLNYDQQDFRENRAFIDFMHDVIRRTGPQDPGLRAAAAAQGEGWLYVIDMRTPEGPQGRVPPEDIIGAFEVEGGRVADGSYRPNEDHRLLTRRGMVRLPPPFHEALVQELMRSHSRG